MRYGSSPQGVIVVARQCSNSSYILHLSLIQVHRRNLIIILIHRFLHKREQWTIITF